MKNENSFINICEKDIQELYSVIEEYFPGYEIKHLNQSAIYDENKKIICRAIKNDKKDVIGHEIAIYCYDNRETIKLIKRKNSIKYERLYYDGNCYVKEKVKVSLNENIIKRNFSYSRDSLKEIFVEEYNIINQYDLYNYFKSLSIENVINNLNKKNKERKRV